MRVINLGIMLVITVAGFFVSGSIRSGRIGFIMFDRMLSDRSVDGIAKDILDLSVEGIDEYGDAVISGEKININYKTLINKTMGAKAEDTTGFFIHLKNDKPDGDEIEKLVFRQIKTVNKRLNYCFLFTEYTSSFRYNPISENSVYIMYLPKFSNNIKVEKGGCVYTLSGAKLE